MGERREGSDGDDRGEAEKGRENDTRHTKEMDDRVEGRIQILTAMKVRGEDVILMRS